MIPSQSAVVFPQSESYSRIDVHDYRANTEKQLIYIYIKHGSIGETRQSSIVLVLGKNTARASGIFFLLERERARDRHRLRAIRSFTEQGEGEGRGKRARERGTLSNPVSIERRLFDSSNPFNPMNLATHNVSSLRNPSSSLPRHSSIRIEIKRENITRMGRVREKKLPMPMASHRDEAPFAATFVHYFQRGECRNTRRIIIIRGRVSVGSLPSFAATCSRARPPLVIEDWRIGMAERVSSLEGGRTPSLPEFQGFRLAWGSLFPVIHTAFKLGPNQSRRGAKWVVRG